MARPWPKIVMKNSSVFRSKSFPAVVFVIAVLAFSSSFGLGLSRAFGQNAGSSTISLGVVQSPVISSLNYIAPTENYYFVSELYLPFAAYAFPPAADLEPVLASGWSSNSNYSTWVLNLKSGLKWDDGSPLNATDLWYTWLIENDTSGFSFAADVKNISILNSTAIQVKTDVSEPNLVYFYCQQTNSYILPYKTYKSIRPNDTASLDNFTNFNNIVASGPFIIRNYVQGSNPVVFTANPYYYKGRPHMSQLNLYNYASLSSELAAYKTNQINALWGYGAYTVIAPLLQNVTGQRLYKIVPGAEMGVYFNMASYPYNVTQFRQALAYSTNRTAINAIVNDPTAPLVDYDNLIPSLETQIGLGGSTVPTYSYNLTAASQLLSSIGFKKVNGFWANPNGTAFTINIITADQGYGEPATAQVLNSEWKNAGFNVNLVTLSFTSYLTIEESTSGWDVAIEIDNAGYYPNALGNLLGLVTGTVAYSGAMNLSLAAVSGVANYNYTAINSILQLAIQYPLLSSQSNMYAKQAAPLVGSTVPIIPLFVINNYQSVSTNYYWGDPANLSGIFNTQALMQPQLWYEALWTVRPTSALTASTTSTPGATTTTGTVPTSASTTAPSPASNNYLLYAGIVAVIVIVLGAGMALTRRRGRTSPPASP